MNYGTGATISFSSGFLAEILDISLNGEVEELDTTHMGTTNARTSKPSALAKWEATVEIFHRHDQSPPLGNAQESIVITAPSDGTGGTSTWTYTGYMKSYAAKIPLEQGQTATCVLAFNTEPAVVA